MLQFETKLNYIYKLIFFKNLHSTIEQTSIRHNKSCPVNQYSLRKTAFTRTLGMHFSQTSHCGQSD